MCFIYDAYIANIYITLHIHTYTCIYNYCYFKYHSIFVALVPH